MKKKKKGGARGFMYVHASKVRCPARVIGKGNERGSAGGQLSLLLQSLCAVASPVLAEDGMPQPAHEPDSKDAAHHGVSRCFA